MLDITRSLQPKRANRGAECELSPQLSLGIKHPVSDAHPQEDGPFSWLSFLVYFTSPCLQLGFVGNTSQYRQPNLEPLWAFRRRPTQSLLADFFVLKWEMNMTKSLLGPRLKD